MPRPRGTIQQQARFPQRPGRPVGPPWGCAGRCRGRSGVGPDRIVREGRPGDRTRPAPWRPQLFFAWRAAGAATRPEFAQPPGRQCALGEPRQVERDPAPAARAVAFQLVTVPGQVGQRRESNRVNPCHARRVRVGVVQGVTHPARPLGSAAAKALPQPARRPSDPAGGSAVRRSATSSSDLS